MKVSTKISPNMTLKSKLTIPILYLRRYGYDKNAGSGGSSDGCPIEVDGSKARHDIESTVAIQV